MDKKIKLAFTFMSRDEMSVTSVSPFSFRSCNLFGDNLLTIMFVGGFRTMAGWMVKPKTETLGVGKELRNRHRLQDIQEITTKRNCL